MEDRNPSDNQRTSLEGGRSIKQSPFKTETISERDFKHTLFKDIDGKEKTFRNCDFSYCVFIRAYFRKAKFKNCKFIGSRFYDCNFRGAELTECDFDYAQFKDTLIASYEVMQNLPKYPNQKRDLMQFHRVNAESIGDFEAIKIYVRAELEATREHWRKARIRSDRYYKDKYPGVKNYFKACFKSLYLLLDWIIWGHGEYPGKLFRSILVLLVGYAVWIFFQIGGIAENTTIAQIGILIWDSVIVGISIFLGTPSVSDEYLLKISWGTKAIIVLTRYVSLGLFISALFRQLSKR